MSDPPVPAIEIRGLTKRFGSKEALKSIDLTVTAGSVFGFLGPNGAGKSTTLNILNGLVRPSSGSVRLLGRDAPHATNEIRAEIGYLPDVPSFYPWMNAREFLRFVGALFGLEQAVLDERIAALLELAGLSGVDDRIGGYSRGMRQRLGIAQALINAPRLLLLDEPTSALDPIGRKSVLEMIEALAGRTTIFFSSHLLTDVERVCDTIAILDKGRVVIQGATAELRAKYGLHRLTMTLRTRTEAEIARGALQTAPWLQRSEIDGATLLLTIDDLPTSQRDVPAILAAHQIGLVRLESGDAGLEEVFFDLIETAR